MKYHVNAESLLESRSYSKLPVAYFFIIVFLYFGAISPMVFAGALVGVFYRPGYLFSQWFINLGVRALMASQFWIHPTYRVKLYTGDRPVLYVSNHRSHLDVFFLMTQLPLIRVLAKFELLFVPFLGPMMVVTSQILTKRGINHLTKAMEKVKRGILKGDHVVIFPEMTRCTPGLVGTQKFQSIPFSTAREVQAVVVPICIFGTDEAWPKGTLGISTGHRVVLESLEPIDSRNFKSAKDLAEAARSSIETAFIRIKNDH